MRILTVLTVGTLLLAQDQTPTLKVDVDVVSILATVRDKKNALIPNLQKDDFTVLEDGKPQTIKYFTKETDLPLTIGLLVDVSGSQDNLIDIERRAATQFFTQVLRKKDEAFLISFGEESRAAAGLHGQSAPADRRPEPVARQFRSRRHPSGSGAHHQPGRAGTVLYDAIYLAANEKLKGEVGRKVIVVITDGVDQGSRLTRSQAIEAAQKADAVIYSIDYEDPRFHGMFGGRPARATCARCPTRPAATFTRWIARIRSSRSSRSCRTRCAASTPSAIRRPTT